MGGGVPIGIARRDGQRIADEVAVYRDRARRLGLPFQRDPEGPLIRPVDLDAIRTPRFAMSACRMRWAFIAPEEDGMEAVLDWLACYPDARQRLRVTTPSAIRAALLATVADDLADAAVSHLAEARPDLSARRVMTAGQIAVALVAAAGLAAAAVAAPGVTALALNVVAAGLFFGVTALRLAAASYAGTRPLPQPDAGEPVPDDALPVYSVLVPLYREAALVPQLVASLDRIAWPRARLDIKLVLEAGDEKTITAARRLAAHHEIVVVPPAGPRTKPKALAFALPLARGEFVTVYDAEDRPHPEQLREAYAAFSDLPETVACLQSPLAIDNRHPTWLSRSFAIEYAAIFDAILPTLAIAGMPLPLGGTSNHFSGLR